MFELTAIRKLLVVVGPFLATGVATCSLAQMQDFGNRREGTTVHVDALEDFTLVALHRNFQRFSRNANLKVRFFIPQLPNDANKEVVVEALELQDSVHYLMQSKNVSWNEGTWNVFGQWPTRDMIDPLNIEAENLGVLAEYRNANRNGHHFDHIFV